MPPFSTPRPRPRPRPAGDGGGPSGALPRSPPRRRGAPRRAPRPRPRAGPAAAGRGAATSTPRRRVAAAAALALALGLALGLALLLLPLTGGPAGAAAQPPAPLPPALAAGPRAPEGEADGRARKLPACATVSVSSGDRGTCKSKKDGKVLIVKDPVVTVLQDGEEEPATPLSPNRFVKQFAETYSPGAGPTADAAIAGEAAVAVALDGLGFKKSKAGAGKLKGKVDPSDREALAALDPAAGPCVLEFRTSCGGDGEDGEDGGCTYADTTCAVGATCPGGTAVSAACADRSNFAESPCACTALQQLAALSSDLQTEAPWNDLANAAYCQAGSLEVDCATVGGVQLPTDVNGINAGLVGALPPSLGELGPSLMHLDLFSNAITSVPTELGALTGLYFLYLSSNAITSVPTELGALTGLEILDLNGNAITSVPTEIGALTVLVDLGLSFNAITSVPTEIGALAGLTYLDLSFNQLTGVPADFRTVDPSDACQLYDNPRFSCANVGAGTTCCTADNCYPAGTSTCYQG